MIGKNLLYLAAGLLLLMASCTGERLTVSCRADNDLWKTLVKCTVPAARYDSPYSAVEAAHEGSALLVLADDYPAQMVQLDSAFYKKAASKKLRLYIEYPSFLPGFPAAPSRGTQWERAVISSDAFSPGLGKGRILAIHDCRFIPLQIDDPDIVVARVAGLDSAVYGLPEKVFPVLAEIPMPQGTGSMMISTTRLSSFIRGRYAPAEAWELIWKHILGWLQPGLRLEQFRWEPDVRPSFGSTDPLPGDAEREALRRSIGWYFRSGMMVSEDMLEKYNRETNLPLPAGADPDTSLDWPFGHRVGFRPQPGAGVADGSLGVLEGFDAKIFHDGSQPVRWWRRGDCNGEIAGAMGLAGAALGNDTCSAAALKIADWLFFRSMITLGDRSDPGHPAYGLSGWNDVAGYCGPGTMDGFSVYYGDDNARVILGMAAAASTGKTGRYDRRIMNLLLGNLRVSGKYGFQPDRLDQAPLEKTGWKHFFSSEEVSFSPHYQANMWACYLWAYKQTGFRLFLERAETAIRMTMEAYPGKWKWTNGIQQERAKMLLPLAWLVRTDDTKEHREWLNRIASDLVSGQDSCGAIPEETGAEGMGGFPPPSSNEAYGTSETPLIQTNNDRVSDLLYTIGFAFLGLHEAAAATGDPFYSEAEGKLAGFLCRIQVKSTAHPELDGGWFRAFDYRRWEYWASNADAGWGAWSIEAGWSQSWITSVFALRLLNTSLWDQTANSTVSTHFSELRKQMLPDAVLRSVR